MVQALACAILTAAPAPAPLLAEEAFLDRLEIETTLEANFERFGNRDLDDRREDGISVFRPEIVLEMDYRASERIRAFTEIELERETVVQRGRDADPLQSEVELNVKQLYMDIGDLREGLTLRAGRQEFKDEREWLYDEDLDGLRAFYRRARLSLEASATRERLLQENLLENEDSNERVNNYMVVGSYRPFDENLVSAYAIVQDDRTDNEESPIFYGLRARGEATEGLTYWLELAHVRGRDDSDRLRGFGADLGGTYRIDAPFEPSLTFGYAFGSGDSDTDDDVDRGFRQTGLEDNSHRFNGVEEFRYYGETLDPELRNLKIFTAGVGIRPTLRSSVDLIYHRYSQDVADDDRIEGARVRERANGESRDLGQGVDLILGYHDIPGVRLRAKAGYFIPGDAFGDDASESYSLEIGVEFSF